MKILLRLYLSAALYVAATLAGSCCICLAAPESGEDSKLEFDIARNDILLDSGNDDARKKVIELAQTITPPPEVPEDARRAMAGGKIEFQKAADPAAINAALEAFKEAADMAPWWADAYFNLGLVQEKKGMYAEAAKSLGFYLLAAPNAGDAATVKDKVYQLEYLAKQKKQAEDHINRGAEYANSGNYAMAMEEAKEAVRLDPTYGLAHANLGAAFVSLDRHKEAIPELKEALRLGYDMDLLVYFRLSISLERAENNMDEAAQVLEEALSKGATTQFGGTNGPAIASVYKNLGYYYALKKQYQRSTDYYEKALAVGHTNVSQIHECIEWNKRQPR